MLIDKCSSPFPVLKHILLRPLHKTFSKWKCKVGWGRNCWAAVLQSPPPLASTQPFRHGLHMIKAASGKTHPEHTANMFNLMTSLRVERLPTFCSSTFLKNSAQAKKRLGFFHVQTKAPDNAGCKLNPYQHWNVFGARRAASVFYKPDSLKISMSVERRFTLCNIDFNTFMSCAPPAESILH